MLRQQLGLLIYDFGEGRFEHRGDARVKFPPLAAQQGPVSGVLQESVFEGIDRVRRRAAAVEELGSDQASQFFLQLLLRKPVHDLSY
jgi:hypothetical protein